MGKRSFAGSVLFPLNLSRHSLVQRRNSTFFFPLSRCSPKGEDGKPFPGIYLFALQKDKYPSSLKKFSARKLVTQLLLTCPRWKQSIPPKSISVGKVHIANSGAKLANILLRAILTDRTKDMSNKICGFSPA